MDISGWISNRYKNFFFAIASKPALGRTQPPIQWPLRALSWRKEARSVKLLAATKVKNNEDTSPFLHTFQWCDT
jgi:hypothetical protein